MSDLLVYNIHNLVQLIEFDINYFIYRLWHLLMNVFDNLEICFCTLDLLRKKRVSHYSPISIIITNGVVYLILEHFKMWLYVSVYWFSNIKSY